MSQRHVSRDLVPRSRRQQGRIRLSSATLRSRRWSTGWRKIRSARLPITKQKTHRSSKETLINEALFAEKLIWQQNENLTLSQTFNPRWRTSSARCSEENNIKMAFIHHNCNIVVFSWLVDYNRTKKYIASRFFGFIQEEYRLSSGVMSLNLAVWYWSRARV